MFIYSVHVRFQWLIKPKYCVFMLLLAIFLIKMAFIKGEPFQRRQPVKTTLNVRISHAQKADRLILFSTGSQKVKSKGDPLFLQNFRNIGQQISTKLIFENRSRRKRIINTRRSLFRGDSILVIPLARDKTCQECSFAVRT